jgi:hypothetical protein
VKNPFDRYDLDPREGVAAITQRLRELATEAKTEAEREEIRAAWEELTLHPARRLRAALFAHPETRAPLGLPPIPPRLRHAGLRPVTPTLRDLALLPSLSRAVGSSFGPKTPSPAADSLEDDPALADDP